MQLMPKIDIVPYKALFIPSFEGGRVGCLFLKIEISMTANSSS
jgi:hypothetical protein